MTTTPTGAAAASARMPDLTLVLAQFAGRSVDLPTLASTLAERMPAYGVDTPRRIGAFLAQVSHECGGFTITAENLNYSADGLCRTWPKRFPGGLADHYAKRPEAIANRAYADRMGNGSEASGDGWRYRGRGFIQVTGKDNYSKLARATNRQLDTLPAWLETMDGAVTSALWFWQANRLNRFADAWDIEGLTRAINGGLNGLEDRRRRHGIAAAALTIAL